MADEDALPKDLQLVYEELVRLEGRVETMTQSSFEDFKLLGALGAVLGLSPVTEYFKDEAVKVSGEVELLMFLTLFSILAVIAFRDLMKQSLIRYLMAEANVCAKILADKLEPHARPAFESKARWETFARERHSKVARNFTAIVLVPATLLPAWVLRETPGYAVGYAAAVILTGVVYSSTANLAVGSKGDTSPSALRRS